MSKRGSPTVCCCCVVAGMAAERSASGYTAICLEDSWKLAAEVLARR